MKRALCLALLSLVIIAGLALAVSCGGSSTTTPPTTTPVATATVATTTPASGDNRTTPPGNEVAVSIEDYEYVPPALTIPAGTTVTWTNKDAVRHTVTERNSLFDSGLLGKDEIFSYIFNEPGEYEYYCIPHPFMVGEVIVE